mgnify:CR=1 FL=1
MSRVKATLRPSIHSEETVHLCLALRLADINIDEDGTELVRRVFEMVKRKGGRGTLKDVCVIKTGWEAELPVWAEARRSAADHGKAHPDPKRKSK